MNRIRTYFSIVCLLSFGWSFGQTDITVRSAKNGAPLQFDIQYQNKALHCSDTCTLWITEPVEVSITAHGYEPLKRKVHPNSSYEIYLFTNVVQLDEVVFTDVHHIKNRHETVLNVSKISLKKIEEMGAVDLRDALTFENNIRISRDNSLGSSGLTLMGMGGNNVKIMVDGVPVIGRLFGQLDLEQFNLENTQQIEVIKGPMSVIYGSNALAGTINLISNQEGKRKLSLRGNYETDGQYHLTATSVIPWKDQYVSLSGGRLLFDGWSLAHTDRSFDWIPKEQYNGRLAYHYQTKALKVSYRAEFLRAFLLDRGKPLAPYGENAIDQKYFNHRLDNSLNIDWSKEHSSLSIIAGHNYFKRVKNKYYKDLVTLKETLIPLAEEQDTQRFHAAVLRSIYGFSHHRYETVLGLDANYELGKGERMEGKQQQQVDVALFTSTELKLHSQFILRTGLRYAYNSAFESPLLYSIQARLDLPRSQVFKAAYGKGFRAPSLKELYLDFSDSRHDVYGNDELLSETSHSVTLTYQKFNKWNALWSNTTLDLFFNHIDNKIDLLVLGPLEATYGNIGRYETVGGTINQSLTYKSLRLKLSYSYTGIYNGINETKRSYQFSPQWVIQPAYVNKKRQFSANLFINYFGPLSKVFEDSSTTEQSVQRMDPYTMLDLSINKQFFNQRIKATAGLRNLLNVQTIFSSTLSGAAAHTDSSTSVSISPGRTFFISIRYEIFP